MSVSAPLVLNQKAGVQDVELHPLVLFNILDHFIRRNEGQERVIGTLLGVQSGPNSVTVTNSFPVPHSEGDQVAVDTEFHEKMLQLHQTVNPREEIVGWYATGTALNVMSVLVHDFYGRSCEQPVHLTLDNMATGGSMSLKTYVSSAVSLAKRSFGSQFREVSMTVMPVAPEAVNDLVATERRVDALTTPNRLGTELDGLKRSLKKLGQMLTDACSYVDKVNAGEIQGDKRIGRMLGDAIARIPHHSGADFEKVFTDNIQDMLMVAYLANLTKAQIALSEKLQVMGLAQKQNRRRDRYRDGNKDGDGGGGDRRGDRGGGSGGGGGGGGEERQPPPKPLRERIV